MNDNIFFVTEFFFFKFLRKIQTLPMRPHDVNKLESTQSWIDGEWFLKRSLKLFLIIFQNENLINNRPVHTLQKLCLIAAIFRVKSRYLATVVQRFVTLFIDNKNPFPCVFWLSQEEPTHTLKEKLNSKRFYPRTPKYLVA